MLLLSLSEGEKEHVQLHSPPLTSREECVIYTAAAPDWNNAQTKAETSRLRLHGYRSFIW